MKYLFVNSVRLVKAKHRHSKLESKFVYPYNLGRKRNLLEVFTWQGRPQGDGISWPVVEGCTQYTLTVSSFCQVLGQQLTTQGFVLNLN